MKFHYYIGEGPEATSLASYCIDKLKARNEARHILCSDYGAQGVIESSRYVSGLVFKEAQDAKHFKLTQKQDGHFWYSPRRNCKEGKAFAQRLCDPALVFNNSDYIVKKLNLYCEVLGEHAASNSGIAMYFSVAGIVGEKIIVKIPNTENCEDGSDEMPTIPTWLHPVKESEFLAVQGK